MRTIRLRGGLGNQLFGLAFAHSVAGLTGEPAAVDVGGYRRDRYGRTFQTEPLAAALGLAVVSRRPLLGRVAERTPPASLAAFARRGRSFDGYWQDERYIADPDAVRSLTRSFLLARAAAAPAHDIAIHHRGYGEEAVPSRRAGPPPGYWAAALDRLARRLGETSDVVVVTDDPAAARRDLGPLAHRVVSGDPFDDMAILLAARALVLANSSFSWWAGYCGDADLVTYPRRGAAFHYPRPSVRFVVI